MARDATYAHIRKAYRKLAAKHHPDIGGDPAKFGAIAKAHELLIDPERRERFDRFGDTTEPTDILATARNMLGDAFQAVMVGDVLERGGDPTKIDFVAKIRARLDNYRKKTREGDASFEKARLHLMAMASRFSSSNGESFLERVRLHELARVEEAMRQNNSQLALIDQAEKLLADEAYRFDRQPWPPDPYTPYTDARNTVFGFRSI